MSERTRCPLNLPMSRKWRTYLHGQRLERPSDLQAAWPRGQRTIVLVPGVFELGLSWRRRS